MSKKILISGYIGFGNFGDDTIFYLLVNYLKSKGAKVSALSKTPEKTAGKYDIKAYPYLSPIGILRAVVSCDVLFSGGGSLLQNVTSNGSLLYYLMIIFLAKLFGKKVVIFAQGFEGIKGIFLPLLTKNILKSCDLITVRDIKSKQIMNDWNINSELVCDPVHSMPLEPRTPKGIVGIQLRKTNLMHPLLVENLADTIGKYFKNKKIKVFSLHSEYDEKICTEFALILQKKYPEFEIEINLSPSFKKVVAEFANLDYLFAMRYHACLLALRYDIPTLPIAYDEKIISLAKEFKIDYYDCSWDRDFVAYLRGLKVSRHKDLNVFDWKLFDNFIK